MKLKSYKKIISSFVSILFFVESGYTKLGEIDVSGPNGVNGSNGHSRSGSASSGSFGGNGTNGQNGGNAGSPTSGQNSGNINANLSWPKQGVFVLKATLQKSGNQQTNLFSNEIQIGSDGYFILKAVGGDGGNGGKPGEHGKPGSGGSGGSGGNSHSWNTYSYNDVSNTDSQGNTTYSTETTTHYHSNSGGMSGYSGSTGRRATSTLHKGADGINGPLFINVLGESGEVSTYQSRYNLALINYNIAPEDQDGILEPGEKVMIQQLTLKNTGGMPTPTSTKIRLFLKNSKYSIAEAVDLEIPKSLAAGETYTFNPETLNFVIKNNIFEIADQERIQWSDHIQPFAEMNEVKRPFTQFSNPRSIEITYPIEIEPIVTSRAIAPGESATVVFRIKNISTKDFGSSSEIKRQINLFIRKTNGDLDTQNFEFKDSLGNPWDMQKGILKAIDHLKAGESAIVEGNLHIKDNAEAFTQAEFGVRLDLTTPAGATKVTSIQDRSTSFSVSKVYRKDPSANVLLIINQSITKKQIAAYETMITDLGLKPVVWDISFYGEMALNKILQGGTSLKSDFAGMNIVILNNEFETNSGAVSATQLFSHTELAQAAAKDRIGTLIIGGNQTIISQSMELATTDEIPEINITKWKLWGKPNNNQLELIAQNKFKKISLLDPEGKYIIVHQFNPEVIKSGPLGIGKVWNLGSLQIYSSLGLQDAPVVSLGAEQLSQLNNDEINSQSTKFALAMSLSVTKRLQLISKLQNNLSNIESKNNLNLLMESLILTIAEEQSTIRKMKWHFKLSDSMLEERMIQLSELVKNSNSLSPDQNNIETQKAWAYLLSSLKKISTDSKKWWEMLIPFRTDRIVSNLMDGKIKLLEKKLFPQKGFSGKRNENQFTTDHLNELQSGASGKSVSRPKDQIRLGANKSQLVSKQNFNSQIKEKQQQVEEQILKSVLQLKDERNQFISPSEINKCHIILKK